MLLIVVMYSLATGPITIPFDAVFNALFRISAEDNSSITSVVIHHVRLPRTLLAIAVGAMLALTGAAMQGLFRNPLADPGIVGVSSGAALGAALGIVLFGQWYVLHPMLFGGAVLPLFAFAGGVVSTLFVYRLAKTPFGTSIAMMLLSGVAVSAFAGAGLGFLNYYADDQALRELSLWSMGSLSGVSDTGLIAAFVVLVISFVLFNRHADDLNALLLGENEARYLGINVQRVKMLLIIYTAACVGFCVSLSGLIGFVGLVVPHIVRMITGPDHRTLLPLSTLCGALLLVISDVIARNILAPTELPVGLITAAIGAPFFILLLLKQRGQLS